MSYKFDVKSGLSLDFTSNIVHGLAFGAPKFCITSYHQINHGLVNLSCNCDVKISVEVLHVSAVGTPKFSLRLTVKLTADLLI